VRSRHNKGGIGMDSELRKSLTDIEGKIVRVERVVGQLQEGLADREAAWVRILLTGVVAGAVVALSRRVSIG
jgi:hypothetical protein